MPFIQRILAFFFPAHCPLCRDVLPYGQDICLSCRQRIGRLGAPVLRLLGAQPGILCIAPFCYEGEVRQRLIGLKERENRAYARLFAPFMAELVRKQLPDWEGLTLTCVPCFEPKGRVYNAARVLARHTARELGLPFLPDALFLPREKRRQHELGARERQTNVQGLFLPGCEPVVGRRILLVDDIVTTGATLYNCAGALVQAGASEVIGLAAASPPWEKYGRIPLEKEKEEAVEQTGEKVYTGKEGPGVF